MSPLSIILLVSAVQFVNVLDFIMVMPLGPDFAKALNIPMTRLGWIAGSYLGAASLSGLFSSFFLDRFDRKKALLVTLAGLAVSTALAGFAWDFHSLLMARVIAGIFGGPTASLSLSIIADVVPPARRGRAMGYVMGAFSIASIFGVPAGLELARLGGWNLPFFAVGALILIVLVATWKILPSLTLHLQSSKGQVENVWAVLDFLRRKEYLLSFLTITLVMLSAFMMIPHIATYLQYNLGYPRERLGLLYFVGGFFSLGVLQLAGRSMDRFGVFSVILLGTCMFALVLQLGFITVVPSIPVIVVFVGFMISMSIRSVCVTSLSSRVPLPQERARFMSLQSSVQHLASALGATLSSHFLIENPDGSLIGMPRLATAALILAAMIPFVIKMVEDRVKAREKAQSALLECPNP